MSVVGDGIGGAMDMDVFEVFQQEREGSAMRHAGSVKAPDADLAEHYAREFYGRRQESVRLWVVPRAAIREVSDPDLLQPPLDRSFKKPVGYSAGIKAKLAEVRARAGTSGDTSGDTPGDTSGEERP